MRRPNFIACLLLPALAASPLSRADAAPQEPPALLAHGAELSPAAIGWGNLIVPGLGASLSGQPGLGLMEASLEIGTYYGGTFGTREGQFTIDGTVKIPTSGNLYAPLTGQILQEFGLKYHMYNTFYHYQQAALAAADTDRERNNPQPLYTGDWKDVLTAPFKWRNLESLWVWPVILGAAVFEIYTYSTTPISPASIQVSPTAEGLYGFTNIVAVPLGSAFGEEVLFRGFMQRDLRATTGSYVLALVGQDLIFGLIHPPELRPFAFPGGIYYGIMVNEMHGNLEPAIASHFWIDFINGWVTYWAFRRSLGKDTPFAPPLSAEVSIPF